MPKLTANDRAITALTGKLGVMGWPVEHSLSPPMQNAALRAAGLDFVYLAFPVAPERVADAVRSLPALGFRGMNVTLPHKQTCMAALDRTDETVAGIDAVNTITVETGGELVGSNTDAYGLVTSVEAALGRSAAGATYFQVGAGGAGRAMAVGMARAGAARVVIANRTRPKAEELANSIRALGTSAEIGVCGLDDEGVAMARECDIVANATSLGLKESDASPLPAEAFRPGQLAYDSVYVRPETPFLIAARGAGATGIAGLGMLAHQGARSLEIWTGVSPDVELMEQVLREELAKRG